MKFKNDDGVFIIQDGSKSIATSSTPTLEFDGKESFRLTVDVINEEFKLSDVETEQTTGAGLFKEIYKLFPQ
jgi:hypothetical protein